MNSYRLHLTNEPKKSFPEGPDIFIQQLEKKKKKNYLTIWLKVKRFKIFKSYNIKRKNKDKFPFTLSRYTQF